MLKQDIAKELDIAKDMQKDVLVATIEEDV
jgi:hypothetical protein